MTNEELLQKILNSTIERLGRQAVNYEAEIANLTSQVLILTHQVEGFSKESELNINDFMTKDS